MSERILVVDDDPDVVKLFSFILTKAGYQVDAALDGEAALAQAHATPPDVIVLDVMMPGLNGFEVAQRLRVQPDTATIPIIMLTARAVLPDQVEGMLSGASSYLVKPIAPATLVKAVQGTLASSRARSSS